MILSFLVGLLVGVLVLALAQYYYGTRVIKDGVTPCWTCSNGANAATTTGSTGMPASQGAPPASKDPSVLQWKHTGPPKDARFPVPADMNPTSRYAKLHAQFGPPTLLDPRPGGSATWDARELAASGNGHWSSITLSDEMIPHARPQPHYDFLMGIYHLGKTSERRKVGLLNSALSESIKYDPLSGDAWIRCHDMVPNIASAWTALQVISGTPGYRTAGDLSSRNLQGYTRYEANVMAAMKDSQIVKTMHNDLVAHRRGK